MSKNKMFLNIPKYSLFLFTKKNIWEKIFLEIFNIFMNNMVSVEAAKVLQYRFTALPMVVPCVQTNVVWLS